MSQGAATPRPRTAAPGYAAGAAPQVHVSGNRLVDQNGNQVVLHGADRSGGEDPNSTTTLGTQQQIWDCTGGANQTWTHTPANQLTLTIGATTLCLDAYNNQTSPGTKVETWTCNGGTNQQWLLNSNGTITGMQSGLCLDVTGASTTDGALVELWTCTGASNQQWKLG